MVAVLDETNGSALLSLRNDVANEEAVRTTGEATVREQGNVLSETSTHDSGRRLQHLRHTRSTLGTLVADDDDGLLTLLELAALESRDEVVLGVEDTSLTLEAHTLLAGDLSDGAAGGERATEDSQVTGLLDGVAERAQDVLVLGHIWRILDVLLDGLTGDGDAVAVNETLVDEVLEHARCATNLVHISHDVLARRL